MGLVTALICDVPPTFKVNDVGEDNVIPVIFGLTLTVILPIKLSLIFNDTIVLPSLIPLTLPFSSTVAILGSSLSHLILLISPLVGSIRYSIFLVSSTTIFILLVDITSFSICGTVGFSGSSGFSYSLTVILTLIVLILPSADTVPVTLHIPLPTAVTTPLLTVATLLLLLNQFIL